MSVSSAERSHAPRAPPVSHDLLRGFVIPGSFGPVDDIPDGFEVFGPAILVFEIIGVFPDVHAEDGFAFGPANGFAHERVVLVGGGNDLEFVIIEDEPGPAAAEPAHGGRFKFFLERVEAAESGFDVVAQFAGGDSAGLGGEQFPEQGMVGVSAAVVSDDVPDLGGNGVEVADQLFDGFLLEIGFPGDGLV